MYTRNQLSLLDVDGATAVVDLGCGQGEHLRTLAQTMPAHARLVGLDIPGDALAVARGVVGDDPRILFLKHDVNEDTRLTRESWTGYRIQDFGSIVNWGKISQAEYGESIGSPEKLAGQQQYFYAITMFSYVGVKQAQKVLLETDA